jgi:hypothetical protein
MLIETAVGLYGRKFLAVVEPFGKIIPRRFWS